VISLEPLAILTGRLPPRVLGLVFEWATVHRAELCANWELAQRFEPLNMIDPLP